MKKLTASVLMVVLSASFVVVDAQNTQNDTIRTEVIEEVVFVQPVTGRLKVRDEVTNAQTIVGAEQLTQAANPNAVSALTGKVSGLKISQTNNSVNSTQSIQIRTPRSITGSAEALVVIDNVISSATVLGQIPPDAIESMNIIKGAAGAALYGSQGVNGVVVVTTKRGSSGGKLRVNFNSSVDFESVAFLPERQRLYGQGWYGDKINVENGAWGPAFSDPTFAGTVVPYGIPLYDFNGDGVIQINADDFTPTPDDPAAIQSAYAPYGKDNVRDFFQTGSIFQNTLSVTTGNTDGYFGLTLGSLEKEFIVMDDQLSRYSALIKGGAKVGQWSFDGQVNFIRQKTSQADASLYHDLLQASSDVPITRFREYGDNAYAWNKYYPSPYYKIKHDRSDALRNYFNIIGSVRYEFNDHVNLTYRGNVNFTNVEGTQFDDGWDRTSLYATGALAPIQSNYFETNATANNYYGDLLLNMNYDLMPDLNMDLSIGHNYQDWKTKNKQSGGTGLIIPGLYSVQNLVNQADANTLNNDYTHRNTHALLANLDLGYRKYLYLNIAGRYEMNSVLVNKEFDNKSSYAYPAVSASFIPTKAFNFGGDILNYMKLTAAWQQTAGAGGIAAYGLSEISSVGIGFPYSGANGGILSYVSDKSINDPVTAPERVTKQELGLSLGFFNDRITFDGAVYTDKTSDLITFQQTPATSGLNGEFRNIGDMEGKGIEMNINFVPIKQKDIRWDLGLNYTSGYAEITALADGAKEIGLLTYSYAGVYAVEGEKFPVIKGTTYMRDDQGRIIVNATTGLPQVSSTQSVLGQTSPKYSIGLNTSLKVKGFTLSATMDYRTGHKFFSGTMQSMAFSGQLPGSAEMDRTQAYIIPNSVYLQGGTYVANTNVPIYASTFNNPNSASYDPTLALSEYYGGATYATVGENFVLDATAFKIREIGLSYTFSKEILGSSKINELTLGVQARNPFTQFAKENRDYDDPESGYQGNGAYQGFIETSAIQYPNLRTFGGSVSVTF